jgi:hypothetical protein
MKHLLTGTLLAAALALPATEPTAAQGKQAFCATYADEAVALQRQNLRYNCGITGLAWHEWWDGHYGWCKDWVSEEKVEEEQNLRRVRLRNCIDRSGIRGDDRGYRRY